jgi:hypothetical protein
MIDPLFWHKDKIRRLSKIKPTWVKVIKEEAKPKEYFLKFEK